MISYLKLIKKILVSFCNPDTSSKDRLRNAVYCVEFLRLWKQDLLNKGESTRDSHFVTQNIFDGMEINLITLLSLILNSNERNIHQMSSQVCENFFRLLRSFTTIESTVVNFTLKGIISRMRKILFVENVSYRLKDVMQFEKLSEQESSNNIDQQTLSIDDIQNAICAGRIEAKFEASSLKMCQEITSFKDIIKPVKILNTTLFHEEQSDEDDSDGDFFDVFNNSIECDEHTVTFCGIEFSNDRTGS